MRTMPLGHTSSCIRSIFHVIIIQGTGEPGECLDTKESGKSVEPGGTDRPLLTDETRTDMPSGSPQPPTR